MQTQLFKKQKDGESRPLEAQVIPPCPFCNQAPSLYKPADLNGDFWMIRCEKCFHKKAPGNEFSRASTVPADTYEETVEDWEISVILIKRILARKAV